MNINIVDKIEGAPPGSVEFRHIDGKLMGVAITCLGCGEESWIPADKDDKRGWELVSEDPLTLKPSLHHDKKKGGCGWHGYIRDGKWEVC